MFLFKVSLKKYYPGVVPVTIYLTIIHVPVCDSAMVNSGES